MDYTYLFKNVDKKSKLAIIGASRGYGYTLLSQLLKVKEIQLRVVCSTKVDACKKALEENGYGNYKQVVAATPEEVKAADEDAIIIVNDYKLALEADITSVVECTGNSWVGADTSQTAIKRGINVYMVSKELDSVCGPYFNNLAKEHDVVYALVNGDQPRNLVDLYSWGKINGLEIIAIGKSSEYDFVWDREEGTITYTDGKEEYADLPGMLEHFSYKDKSTLKARQDLLKDWTSVISADLCEMNLVSNVTGFRAAKDVLSYPIVRTSELADVFIPVEDGGILERTGVVDVFFQLRETNEASFAGGEFLIVKCESDYTWETLRGKGHIVSKNGKYACIYLPYHFMGIESPITILLGDYLKVGRHEETRQHSLMVGKADRDLSSGTVFKVEGHHHHITGLHPRLLDIEVAEKYAPFYLLNNVTLKRDLKEGEIVSLDDVDLEGNLVFDYYQKGLELE